jgi:fructose-1,6-bisphosphatase I
MKSDTDDEKRAQLRDLENILLAVQMACKTISNLVNRAGLVYSIQNTDGSDDDGTGPRSVSGIGVGEKDYRSDGRYYSMKRLDRLSTNVLKNALKFTGTVRMIVPEAKDIIRDQQQQQQQLDRHHQPGVLLAYDQHSIACLDPLDGSGNADASICTGTVFGVFEKEGAAEAASARDDGRDVDDDDGGLLDKESLLEAVLQPANKMRAAGYCLYSSATVLVFTLGSSVYGFTLDPQIQEFVLTHDRLTIPSRGNVYSCNEANSEGWACEGWKAYLKNLKLGRGETKQRYALRYVGSMVGDVHRTLLVGIILDVCCYLCDISHAPP